MSEFRQNLLREFVEPLEQIQNAVSKRFSDAERREAFRIVHSIKGCSRTFGLPRCAEIAAELESLLANDDLSTTEHSPAVSERLDLLIDAIKHPNIAASLNPRASVSAMVPNTHTVFGRISSEVYEQLTERERASIVSALRRGRRIFSLSASAGDGRFAEDFGTIRDRISRAGEIIAVLPGTNIDQGSTSLQFLASTPDEDPTDVPGAEDLNIDAPDQDLTELVGEIASHVSRVAHEASKKVSLGIVCGDVELGSLTKPVFEILLHLTSNAVDHGFDKSGKIDLAILNRGDAIEISVADDGVGIESVYSDSLSADGEIFDPGFSTLNESGPNSGRGYGLYAVKTEIGKLNGKIRVESRKDVGTRFVVTIPA